MLREHKKLQLVNLQKLKKTSLLHSDQALSNW